MLHANLKNRPVTESSQSRIVRPGPWSLDSCTAELEATELGRGHWNVAGRPHRRLWVGIPDCKKWEQMGSWVWFYWDLRDTREGSWERQFKPNVKATAVEVFKCTHVPTPGCCLRKEVLVAELELDKIGICPWTPSNAVLKLVCGHSILSPESSYLSSCSICLACLNKLIPLYLASERKWWWLSLMTMDYVLLPYCEWHVTFYSLSKYHWMPILFQVYHLSNYPCWVIGKIGKIKSQEG